MSASKVLRAALTFLLVSSTGGNNVIKPVRQPIIHPVFFQCPNFSYDAFYDFENNITTTNINVIQVGSFTGTGCATRGVLRLALAAANVDPQLRRVLVDLFMNGRPTNWVFNLGDSSTNNGYAGDAGNQWWDAEVQGVGSTLTGWYSDNGGSTRAFNVPNLYSTRLTLLAGNGHVIWLPDDNNLFNYFYSESFYALNGQPDPAASGNSNYDLFLGFNRVIGTVGRRGSGVCKVGIKFLPEF